LKPAAALGLAVLAVLIAPQAAEAHGNFAGLGSFYGGLLHPLLVPAEMLAVVSVGLLLGSNGRMACRAGVPAFGIGVSAGLAIAQAITIPALLFSALPLAAAAIAAALLIVGVRIPRAISAPVALAGGVAVGMDATPDAGDPSSILVASAATVLASTAAVLVIAALVLDRKQPWLSIAVRVAGSWIVACALLYFGWAFFVA
jgi:urease accessory protein